MKPIQQHSRMQQMITMLKQFTWGDRFLIVFVFAVSIGFIPWLQSGDPGEAAVIQVNNEVIATLPLEDETQFSVQGPLGETIIEIKAGKVRVLSDPGPQQLCVLQGWISRAGDSLICLPNRVVIQIPGTPSYDGLIK